MPAQMDLPATWTGVPFCETEPLVIIFVALTLLAAINPGSGEFLHAEHAESLFDLSAPSLATLSSHLPDAAHVMQQFCNICTDIHCYRHVQGGLWRISEVLGTQNLFDLEPCTAVD